MPSKIVELLIDRLESEDISYCHWKSNMNLDKALEGHDDLDLLVSRESSSAFEAIISSLHFKEAHSRNTSCPSISHYYGYDEESGNIIHLHVYHRIITGGSILKNHRLPLEQMLLRETRYAGTVRVPKEAAELVLLVIRKMLEHTNLVDLLLFYKKEHKEVERELEWLSDDETEVEVTQLLECWLPALDPQLFLEALKELKTKGTILRRVLLALRINRCLKRYRVHGPLSSIFIRGYRTLGRLVLRMLKKKNKRTFVSGGFVIGVVGPEATGKSTICNAIEDWLNDNFYVKKVHAGKPHSTWLTFLPNLSIPIARKLFPSHRSNAIKSELLEKKDCTQEHGFRFIIFAIRSVMLAFDRSVLLRKVFQKASRGAVVVCDRYPSRRIGAMDSPQLDIPEHNSRGLSIKRCLAKLENSIYKRIPPPDIVIKLTVPVEIALERNVLRAKKGKVEDDDFVKVRHLQSHKQEYLTEYEHTINTNKHLSDTMLEIKHILWASL